MRLKNVLTMAWENMKQRKLRTSLTTLGVVIGITAIIALASLGEGFRATVKERMEQGFELDVLTVIAGSLIGGWRGFNETDVERIWAVGNVTMATPAKRMTPGKLYGEEGKNVTAWVVMAVNFTEFWEVFDDTLFFEEGELPDRNGNESIILGYKVNHPNETETFAFVNDTVKMTISGQNCTFQVAGVLEKTGAAGLTTFDSCVFISLEKIRELYKLIGEEVEFEAIYVKLINPEFSESVAEKIEQNFGRFQVSVLVPITILRQVNQILTMVEIFLTSIASISLLVAGIGIMNIMTVSVMERTREIGILKAVGAKNRTVLIMFLAEAVLVGIIGSVTGIPTGYGVAHGLSYVFSRATPQQQDHIFGPPTEQASITPTFSFWWALGAVIFGIAICVLFGLYPARKASKLDPVEALRYE